MTQHRLWLLLLPCVGLLWVAFYNFRDPTLFGFSFFYWYQLAWVPLSALLTWIAYQTYSMKTDVDNTALAHTAIFIVLGFLAARRFHPEAPQRATTYSSVHDRHVSDGAGRAGNLRAAAAGSNP